MNDVSDPKQPLLFTLLTLKPSWLFREAAAKAEPGSKLTEQGELS